MFMNSCRNLLWISGVVLLSGCTSLLTDTGEIADEGKKHVTSAAAEKSNTHVNRLIYTDEYYVPELKPEIEDKPQWWFKEIGTVGILELPIRAIMKQYVSPLGVNVRYLDGVSSNESVADIVHSGTIGDLIETIKFKSRLTYDLKDNLLTWKRFESDLVTVNAKPYSSDFKYGNDASQGSSGNRNNSSGGSGGATSSIQQYDSGFSSGSREVTYESNESSIWTEIETTLSEMKSLDGKVVPNESNSAVFLRDYPENLDLMKEYLSLINDRQTAQVAIDIQIVTYSRNKSKMRGLSAEAFKQDLATGGVFSFAAGSGVNADNVPAMLGYTQESGKYAGSSVFLNVLDKNGVDYEVNSKTILLANNFPGSAVVGGDVAFAVGSGSTATANVGTSSSLQAGSVRSGNSIYLVPTIVDDNISLLMSGSMTDLKRLREVTAGDAKIEAPEIGVDELGTMFNVQDGNTAVFSEKTSTKNSDESSTAGTCIFFCETKQSESVTERVLLITPRIVRGG